MNAELAWCPTHHVTSVVEEEAEQSTVVGGGYGFNRVADYHVVRLACGCQLADRIGERVEHD